MAGDTQDNQSSWQARPVAAFALRFVVLLVPMLAGIAVSLVLGALVAVPKARFGYLTRLAFLLLTSILASLAVSRLARRLLPLAALMRLTLVFPDQVPSRFRVALRRSGARQLENRLNEAPVSETMTVARQLTDLVRALSEHHRPTRGHSERVRAFADLIGEELGLKPEQRLRLGWAALLHDIGKTTVPVAILDKPGKPSAEEWAVLSKHPSRGDLIPETVRAWLGEWWLGVTEHHEKFDGTGYPRRLGGNEISLSGRIVAVSDSYETMTAARAYKKPMGVADARSELVRCAGQHFDPQVVRAFLNVSVENFAGASRLASLIQAGIGTVLDKVIFAARTTLTVGTVAAVAVVTQAPVSAYGPPTRQVAAAVVTAPTTTVAVTVESPPDHTTPPPSTTTAAAPVVSVEPSTDAPPPTTAVVTTAPSPVPPSAPAPPAPPSSTTSSPPRAQPTSTTSPPTAPRSRPAPVARNDEYSTMQNEPIMMDVLANDQHDGGALSNDTVAVVGAPDHGAVAVNGNNTLTFSPAAQFAGDDSFTYSLCGPDGSCAVGKVGITIVAPAAAAPATTTTTTTVPAQAPIVVSDAASTVQAAPVTIDVLANDSDADNNLSPASLRIVSGPTRGTAVVSNGKVVYTPTGNLRGSDSLDYEVCDTTSRCDQATVDITVNYAALTAIADTMTMVRFTTKSLAVHLNDLGDLTGVSVVAVSLPTHLTVIPAGTTFQFVAFSGWTGTDSMSYKLCRGAACTAPTTIAVTVTN